MKKPTLIKAVLISAIVVIVLFAAAWLTVSYQLSHLENYKESITAALSKALNRDVTYEKGEAAFSLHTGLSLRFTHVQIREKDRSADFLNMENAFLRVDFLPLLRNRVILQEIVMDRPRLSLTRNRAGVLNIADLLKDKKETTLVFRKVTVEKGLVIFLDQSVSTDGLTTSLENLHLKIDPPFAGNKAGFRVTANLAEGNNRGELSLTGTFQPALSGKPIEESSLNASLRLKGTDISHYHPYLGDHVPYRHLAGSLDVETTIAGTLSSFKAKGTVTVKSALLDYPQVFRWPLRPRNVHVEYVLTRSAGHINLEIPRLAIDRLTAAGHFSIKDLDKDDPLLEAALQTSAAPLTEIRSYIPWGIIPQKVGSFIDEHIKGGDFRLIEAALNGKRSQITQMEKQDNAGVLSLRVEASNGVFTIGSGTPAFNDISGLVEIKNRQLSLRNMKGRFGSSPCTLEGEISDFALPGPAVYTVEMTVQPLQDEVIWLLGKEKLRDLSFSGPSTLRLSGKGSADDYRIFAQWDLTRAAYAYPEVIEKPIDRPNQISATIVLTKNAVIVSSGKYDLPPLAISGWAKYLFAGENPLSLNVGSNTFDISEIVAILPALRRFNPAGFSRIAVSGQGDSRDFASFQWKGNASFRNVAFQPSYAGKSVSGLTGRAAFKNDTVETSMLKAHIGNSAIAGQCRINDFRNPQVTCKFTSSLLHTADIGLTGSGGDMNIRDVKGQIAFGDNRLQIESLSCRLDKSIFNLSGDIRNFANPRIVMNLTSPYISGDDVERLLTLNYPGVGDASSSKVEMDASLQVDAGTAGGVDFQKLSTGLKFTRGALSIQSLEASVLNGSLKGKAKVDIRPGGPHNFEAGLDLERISLTKLEGLLDIGGGSLTGTMSLQGHMTAAGRNFDDLKKSAAGTFQIRAEKGILKKYSFLSKIFSILNVSQLLRFSLPDMVKDGMPYKTITAGGNLKNGVLSSDDFFIDSNAMQISAQGKVDLTKEELHSVVGIHPLQTLDMVVAKIPIAGWVLTNEDNHLFTVNFQVDGKWHDPRVIPIPVRSIAQGTLNIFRRLFQLPEKLITDTGEVILGR